MQGFTEPFQFRYAVPIGARLDDRAKEITEVNVPYVCSVGPDADSPHARQVSQASHLIHGSAQPQL